MRRDQWWTAVALSLGLLLVAIPATRASGQSASPSNDVSVRGTVVARPGVDGGAVMLPDIEVFLRDVTGPETEPVLTDLDGRFRIALRAPGAHQICWRGQGWLADCEPAPITIADTIVPRRMVTIAPDLRDDSGQSFATVYGRVTLADGSPCRFTSPFFGVDFTATVRTRAAQGAVAAGLVRANTVGAYVLPRVPTTAVSVGAACDGADTDQAISRSGPTNVTIANARPEILGMMASLAGVPVRRVALAATVDVDAAIRDRDGDAVSFTWKAAGGSGEVTPGGANTATWTLPRATGLHTLYVLVSDGKGGVTQSKLTLGVGGAGPFFSGVVSEGHGRAVAGATVSVNGIAVITDAAGAFALTVPESDADRYVMNVTKRGYVLLSRIFDDGVAGGRWRLHRAHLTTIDPTRPVDVVDPRRHGLRLRMPANALVDSLGARARGRLTVAMASLDADREPLPGDYSAVGRDGAPGYLDVLGAAFVEITDAAGHRYDLAPGAKASLTIPASSRSGGGRPSSVPAWSYNLATGYYTSGGVANPRGILYNFDFPVTLPLVTIAGVPQAAPGCLLVFRDWSVDAGLTVQVSGPGVQTAKFVLNSDITMLAPLPPNTKVTLKILDKTTQLLAVIVDGETLLPLPEGTRKTGQLTKIASKYFPYPTYCTASVIVKFDVPKWWGFPVSKFLTSEGSLFGTDDEAKFYYQGVDPDSTRKTLGDWWLANNFKKADGGFLPGDVTGTRMAYLNTNELGVGRDVHCTTKDGDVACYATHYGSPDNNPGNADLAEQKVADKVSWTLAMEYKAIDKVPPDPTKRIVKFFAFKGGDTLAERQPSVDLDGFGLKSVPRVCLICHGNVGPGQTIGTPELPNNGPLVLDFSSSFREFDVSKFQLSSFLFVNFPQPIGQAEFYKLNQMVKQSKPNKDLADLIDGWYLKDGKTQDSAWVPKAWKDLGVPTAALYSNVIAKSCRTCHIAQIGFSWSTPDAFLANGDLYDPPYPADAPTGPMREEICGGTMPKALITYLNFWRSKNPNQPDTLATFFNWPSCP